MVLTRLSDNLKLICYCVTTQLLQSSGMALHSLITLVQSSFGENPLQAIEESQI
jgi:hypothetical protein